MRTRKLILMIVIVAFTLVVTACQKSQKEPTEHSDHSAHNYNSEPQGVEKSENTEEQIITTLTKEQAQKILAAYLAVKDALVKTDGNAASIAADKLTASLGDTEDKLAEKIRFDAEHIASTKDAGHQRDHLNSLSKNVYSLVKQTKANTATLYLQSCPMEKSNKNALWLSLDSGILNPYFGDQMLDCGNTKDTLN